MKYNTQYEQLRMSEYGRNVQQMVEHCMGLEDRSERQKCAESIVAVMSMLEGISAENKDAQQRIWNHFAAISNYELDIDYPYEISRLPKAGEGREPLKYPAHNIRNRHYGSTVEEFARAIVGIENDEERKELAHLVANHMKRDLSNWNVDSMSDEKVIGDMAAYTDGKVRLDEDDFSLISDGELLSSLISTSVKRKKRK